MRVQRGGRVESVWAATAVAALLICVASPSAAQGPLVTPHTSNQSKQKSDGEEPLVHVEPLSARLDFSLHEDKLALLPDPGDINKLRSLQTSKPGSAWDALARRMATRVLLTWDAVDNNLAFAHLYGKDIVTLDVPGTSEVVHIAPDMAWYNVLNKLPSRYQPGERYHMGPYIQNWSSVGPGFDGHYGVKLKVAW